MNILETDRLIFRHIAAEDYAAICPILQDIEVMYAWEHAFSDKEVTDWINENIMRYERDGYSYWAVIEKASGKLIGVSGLLAEQADGEQFVGVGYIYNKAYWHKGYAFEGAAGCMRYAFEVLGLNEVTASIRPNNYPSRKVAEKLGMTVKKEYVKHYKGKVMPHLLYSKNRDEQARTAANKERPDLLLQNLDKIHTTPMGAERVIKNLKLETDDVVGWCVQATGSADKITCQGKNWYVYAKDAVITINIRSYTIITAHKKREQK